MRVAAIAIIGAKVALGCSLVFGQSSSRSWLAGSDSGPSAPVVRTLPDHPWSTASSAHAAPDAAAADSPQAIPRTRSFAPHSEVLRASLETPVEKSDHRGNPSSTPLPLRADTPLLGAGQKLSPEALPLAGPSRNAQDPSPVAGGLPSLMSVAASLSMVLGAFFVVVWLLRRAAPPGASLLPGEVLEVLGRAPLSGRQQMHLLRCGRKLLLVSVTPAGAETLTEITDPAEVDYIAGLCQQARPNSATAAFRNVLRRVTQEQSLPEPAMDDDAVAGGSSRARFRTREGRDG